MCFDNGIVQGNLGGAVLIGEILFAYAAIPVGGIAVLGAGGILGIGLGHRVTRGCNLFILHGGFGLAVGILKCLAAIGAGVILVVAILGAGGSLGIGLGHRVTRSRNLFILHGGFGLAVGILKCLAASGAGVILVVAILGAGGSLSVGLGHRVMCLDNGIGQGNLGGAILVGEILVANAAMPVGGIAILGAGGSLGIGLGHRVTRGCNLFSLHGGFDLAIGILKCLAAGGAGIILVVAILGAGGSLGVCLSQAVTRGDKLFSLDGSFLRTTLILENLTASRAGVVFGVAIFGTGGSFILDLSQAVGNFRGFFGLNRCFC